MNDRLKLNIIYFSQDLYKNVFIIQCEDDNQIVFCGISILRKYPIKRNLQLISEIKAVQPHILTLPYLSQA